MTKSFKSVSAALLFGALLATPALAQAPTAPSGTVKLSQAECSAIWNKLDSAKSGSVAQPAAQAHVSDFRAVDTNNDAKLSQAEFTAACAKGLVHDSATTGAGTGTGMPSKK